MEMVLALTLGPVIGFAGAWALLSAIRHRRAKQPETTVPNVCKAEAVNQAIDDVRTATARMKSKAGID